MGKKLLALIVFFAVTASFYVVTLIQSIHAYENWKQTKWEEPPSHLRPFLDFAPYTGSQYGVRMILSGAIIAIGWLIVAIFLSKRKLQASHRLTLNEG